MALIFRRALIVLAF